MAYRIDPTSMKLRWWRIRNNAALPARLGSCPVLEKFDSRSSSGTSSPSPRFKPGTSRLPSNLRFALSAPANLDFSAASAFWVSAECLKYIGIPMKNKIANAMTPPDLKPCGINLDTAVASSANTTRAPIDRTQAIASKIPTFTLSPGLSCPGCSDHGVTSRAFCSAKAVDGFPP
jgi:hypothetical protein